MAVVWGGMGVASAGGAHPSLALGPGVERQISGQHCASCQAPRLALARRSGCGTGGVQRFVRRAQRMFVVGCGVQGRGWPPRRGVSSAAFCIWISRELCRDQWAWAGGGRMTCSCVSGTDNRVMVQWPRLMQHDLHSAPPV